jgi:hypothetical protein
MSSVSHATRVSREGGWRGREGAQDHSRFSLRWRLFLGTSVGGSAESTGAGALPLDLDEDAAEVDAMFGARMGMRCTEAT